MKFRGTSNLKAPAWPVQHILANRKAYEQAIALRNTKLHHNKSIGDVELLYKRLIGLQQRRQEIATERNALAKLAKTKAHEANQKDQLRDNNLKTRAKQVKVALAAIERDISANEDELAPLLDSIPNLVAPDTAAVSLDDGFETVKFLGPSTDAEPEKSRDHVAIGTQRGLLDLEAGARVSGTGFYYLVNEGAMLEQALVQYALQKCRNAGFDLVSPPTLVRQQFSEACGFRPRDETQVTQMYSIESAPDGLCLVGTAEIPLAGQFAHRQIDSMVKHAGVCRSYRAEAGARGADTRGLYRVHEFTKVEMFVWSPSNDTQQSQTALNWLVDIQQDIVAGLELPARVIKLAANDLGAPAYQKYDIEAWMPGRGAWGEISSASNCTDFQSRRLHTTTTNGDYVHTLNGTALAVPRIILALIENNWDPETGRISLPKALHPFMGRTYI